MRLNFVILVSFLLGACGHSGSDAVRDFGARDIVLPNGARITCEVMTRPEDMFRGMMYRETLAPDHGMLFVHGGAGRYTYWMHNVKIPLDLIWMDPERRVVEVSPNTPPCTDASGKTCAHYGGHADAMYVLELAAGVAAKNDIKVGSMLDF